ncbi:hypothetical protein GA0070613_6479 [Micromonospora inositola]|uniref:Uncharacterized protein n=2 Tax=Micromonospora inositola TaxID=47865 RepID=A0A1C5GKS7_9ACTN|nr:hypothetical protein GA0070613_0008 [Micromonospora inositola]SCG78150.1 hypothetical protein GA0070613_6479 [Micromonospora inositola]
MQRLDNGRYAYPATTSDIAKLLRLNGFAVTYDHERGERIQVSHNAADAWLPVLAFAQSVLANIPANIISTIIMQYFGEVGHKEKNLHVKFVVTSSDGSEHNFEAHGPGQEVVEAINAFQRSYAG